MIKLESLNVVCDEGLRFVTVKGAEAVYRIVELASGAYAVSLRFTYLCGDHRGRASPPLVVPDRQEAIEHFLTSAVAFFEEELSGSCCTESQRLAQQQMLFRLEGCPLFGFLEPPPS